MPLEDALARVPGLAGYLGQEQFTQRQNAGTLQNATQAQTLQEHFTKAQRERQARDALSQLGPDAGPEAISRAIMPFMGAEGAMRHADTQARIASSREQALARLAQQASQFDRKQLTAEQRLKLDTWYKNQAAAIAQGRAAYDLPPDVYQPPAAPQQPQGVEFNVEGVRGTAPDEASALAIGRRLQGLPAAPQGAPAQPAATPAAPAPAEAPVAAPEQLSGPEPTAPAPAAPVQGAPVARGEVPPPQGAPVARLGDLPTPPKELEEAWAKLGRKGADTARARWIANMALQRDKANTTPTGDFTKKGEEYLQSLNPQDQALVKKVAAYEIDPKTFSIRGGQRERIMSMVSQYDKDFDQKEYNTRYNAINRFATGQQGNTVRSLNVAIEHMDTVQKMGDALKNNDIPAINQLSLMIAKETGKAPPTNFDAVKNIMADEVVKGILGGTTALQDRQEMAAKIRAASSPQQLTGTLNAWRELLGGQLKGLEQQYKGATGRSEEDFRNRFMTPRALAALNAANGGGKAAGGKAPQQAIDFLKGNPTIPMKEAFKAKYGYLPDGI